MERSISNTEKEIRELHKTKAALWKLVFEHRANKRNDLAENCFQQIKNIRSQTDELIECLGAYREAMKQLDKAYLSGNQKLIYKAEGNYYEAKGEFETAGFDSFKISYFEDKTEKDIIFKSESIREAKRKFKSIFQNSDKININHIQKV